MGHSGGLYFSKYRSKRMFIVVSIAAILSASQPYNSLITFLFSSHSAATLGVAVVRCRKPWTPTAKKHWKCKAMDNNSEAVMQTPSSALQKHIAITPWKIQHFIVKNVGKNQNRAKGLLHSSLSLKAAPTRQRTQTFVCHYVFIVAILQPMFIRILPGLLFLAFSIP